ncbi:MAG: hypothetical protein FWC69_03955 [Defluviitaleaceae bacterium]|nr:hypothetical protein [Defluviitaleaceae bacterium]
MDRRPAGRPIQNQKKPQNSRQSPYKRKRGVDVFFAFVFIVIGIYIVGYFRTHHGSGGSESAGQIRLEMGYINPPTTFSGVIVRDEVVYHATRNGSLIFHVENSQRVTGGHVVASVRDQGATEYLRELERLEQEAVLGGRIGLTANQEEIDQRNGQILNMIGNASFDMRGDVSSLQDLGRRVDEDISRRNHLYFVEASQLEAHRQATESQLNNVVNQMSVSTSGTISAYMDGLEGVLTREALGNISRDIIEGESEMRAAPFQIEAGGEAFRLVRSNDWFVASFIPRGYVQHFSIGSRTTIFAYNPEADGDALPLPADVYRLIDNGEYFYIVFRTNFEGIRFINHRNITFQLQQSPTEGFVVPTSAITRRSAFAVPRDFVHWRYDMLVVFRQDGAGTTMLPVTGWNDADAGVFYVISGGGDLRLGDVLVHEGYRFTLDSIETVDGVFVSNRGHAVFRQIYLPLNWQAINDEYIVIDPRNNPNIRLFDWVIRDARGAENRLLLN